MRITDGKRTVEIEIKKWNGSGYDPDWSRDYFDAGTLPYDEDRDAYIVDDVAYCIDMANGTDSEGARCKIGEDGECVPDDDVVVTVTDL